MTGIELKEKVTAEIAKQHSQVEERVVERLVGAGINNKVENVVIAMRQLSDWIGERDYIMRCASRSTFDVDGNETKHWNDLVWRDKLELDKRIKDLSENIARALADVNYSPKYFEHWSRHAGLMEKEKVKNDT